MIRWLKGRPANAPPIVLFEVLEATTVAWLCKSGKIQSFDLKISRKKLATLISDATAQLARARRTLDSGPALEAYRTLVSPWISEVLLRDRISIVPDEDLFRLPSKHWWILLLVNS